MTPSNKVDYSFYEKPVSSNVTVQKNNAMEENSKMTTLANHLTRRMLNTKEGMEGGNEARIQVIDRYSQKLLNSGYRVEQVKKKISNGIKG